MFANIKHYQNYIFFSELLAPCGRCKGWFTLHLPQGLLCFTDCALVCKLRQEGFLWCPAKPHAASAGWNWKEGHSRSLREGPMVAASICALHWSYAILLHRAWAISVGLAGLCWDGMAERCHGDDDHQSTGTCCETCASLTAFYVWPHGRSFKYFLILIN